MTLRPTAETRKCSKHAACMQITAKTIQYWRAYNTPLYLTKMTALIVYNI